MGELTKKRSKNCNINVEEFNFKGSNMKTK